MEFRPCPSYFGYSASRCGQIRRDDRERVSKTGKVLVSSATILKRVGRNKAFVTLGGRFVRWQAMVDDAWSITERPAPLYPGGRVLTLAEFIAEARAKKAPHKTAA